MPYFPPASTGGGATALSGLSDVVLTTPTATQVLKYDGANWVNATDATGGGGGGITVTRTTITVPANQGTEYFVAVTDATATATSKVNAKLVLNTSIDQNGVDELEGMGVFAIPTTGSITFTLTKRGPFVGPFYIDYFLA